MRTKSLIIALLLCSPALLQACIICNNMGVPLIKEVSEAKLVVFGRITDARLGPDGIKGTSDFAVESILQGDSTLIKNNRLVFPRYVPPVAGVKYIVFLDVNQGQLDPYRSIVCSSDRLVQYLQKMPKLTGAGTPQERQARLKYTFDYFQDAEPELAADAYKIWSVATNQDAAAVASQVDASKLRRWLLDPKTPQHCLALYGFLLGASGQPQDAELLKKLALTPPDPRFHGAIDGILLGLERQQSNEVWGVVKKILQENQRSFTERYAVLKFLRFLKDVQGDSVKAHIVASLAILLDQPEMMDLAIEQMRQMAVWDHQASVLKLWDNKANLAPITLRAIVRYALSCPGQAAQDLLARVRKDDPEMVKSVEELIHLGEKP
ncbi:MAG: hypothetical protein U0796_18120 [Gemmatales bacterium]